MPKKKQTKSNTSNREPKTAKSNGKDDARERTRDKIYNPSGTKEQITETELSESKRKFSKRVIESNWAKYDEDPSNEDGNNDMLNQTQSSTGTYFETLVSQAGKNISTFKFKDEYDMVDDQSETQNSYAVENNGPLDFDLESAGSSLNDIPVYEKLGIGDTLQLIKGSGQDWQGEYLASLKEQTKEHFHRKAIFCHPPKSGHLWNFDGIEQHKKKIHIILGQLKKERTNGHIQKEPKITGEKQKLEYKAYKTKDEEQPLKLYDEIKHDSGNDQSLDDELDFLLSLDSPNIKEDAVSVEKEKPELSETQNIPYPDVENKSTSGNENAKENSDEIEFNKKTDRPAEVFAAEDAGHTEENVDELEDWLDSILD